MDTDQTSSDSNESTKMNEIFNASDADVSIQSSEGVIFKLHRFYLAATAGAFPGTEIGTKGEIVVLEEPEDVLQVVFQFTYPKRHPSLKGVEFNFLRRVAEAAEKYEVFSAMAICEVRLKEFLPIHAMEILKHALEHDNPDLINEASRAISRRPLHDTLKKLPLTYAFSWITYHEAWTSIFEEAVHKVKIKTVTTDPNSCSVQLQAFHGKHKICLNCLFCLLAWIGELERIEDISALEGAILNPVLSFKPENLKHERCSRCKGNDCLHLKDIQKNLKMGIDSIPAFTSMM